MDNLETRTFPAVELRVTEAKSGSPSFEGYAAVFNSWSEDLGGFKERLSRGSFRNALKTSDTVALFNHDANHVLGRVGAKTLALKEDKKGLRFSINPPDTQFARDLAKSVARGDIHQCSFGFTLAEGGDEWKDKGGEVTRTIREVNSLSDVSLVCFPAYKSTDVSVALRSMEASKKEMETQTEAEQRNESIQAMVTEIEETIVTYMSEVLDENQQTRFITMCEKMVKDHIPGEPMQAEEKKDDEVGETREEPDGETEPMQETADISLEDRQKFWAVEGD